MIITSAKFEAAHTNHTIRLLTVLQCKCKWGKKMKKTKIRRLHNLPTFSIINGIQRCLFQCIQHTHTHIVHGHFVAMVMHRNASLKFARGWSMQFTCTWDMRLDVDALLFIKMQKVQRNTLSMGVDVHWPFWQVVKVKNVHSK